MDITGSHDLKTASDIVKGCVTSKALKIYFHSEFSYLYHVTLEF